MEVTNVAEGEVMRNKFKSSLGDRTPINDKIKKNAVSEVQICCRCDCEILELRYVCKRCKWVKGITRGWNNSFSIMKTIKIDDIYPSFFRFYMCPRNFITIGPIIKKLRVRS